MNPILVPKKARVNTTATPGFKEQMRIGSEIAEQLDEVKSRADVAAELGISRESVRIIECRALAKIALRMKQLALKDRLI